MRLINTNYDIDLEFKENETQVLVIESKQLLSELLWDFLRQYSGSDRDFILSSDNKILNIAKSCDLIIDPFRVDFNNRRINTKLHQELSQIIQEDFYEEIGNINTLAMQVLDGASSKIPYPLIYNINTDISAFLKIYDIKIDDYSDNLLERICIYLKLMSSICDVKLFIIVGISNFIDNTGLRALYETAFYEKVSLLIIENNERDWLNNEEVTIIDKDRCLIQI